MTSRTYPHGIQATREDVREGMRVMIPDGGGSVWEGTATIRDQGGPFQRITLNEHEPDRGFFTCNWYAHEPVTILTAPDEHGVEWELGVPGSALQVGDVVRWCANEMCAPDIAENMNRSHGLMWVTEIRSDRRVAVARTATGAKLWFGKHNTVDRRITPAEESKPEGEQALEAYAEGRDWWHGESDRVFKQLYADSPLMDIVRREMTKPAHHVEHEMLHMTGTVEPKPAEPAHRVLDWSHKTWPSIVTDPAADVKNGRRVNIDESETCTSCGEPFSEYRKVAHTATVPTVAKLCGDCMGTERVRFVHGGDRDARPKPPPRKPLYSGHHDNDCGGFYSPGWED